MNRATLTKIHLLLAAFVLPVACMFLLTGGLYTWDIKGSYQSEIYDVELSQPLVADVLQLTQLASQALQRLGVEHPSGGAVLKRAGTSFQLEWTGSARDVVLEPTENPLLAQLVVKETSWYRHFVQLHKAKGGQLFKVYAVIWAVALLAILISGFLLAWQVPKYRLLAVVCAGAGMLTFVLMVALS